MAPECREKLDGSPYRSQPLAQLKNITVLLTLSFIYEQTPAIRWTPWADP